MKDDAPASPAGLRPAPPQAFAFELPALPTFRPGGMGHQCAVRCQAGCCKYFSLPIDTPRSDLDHDNIRWYLMHEGVHVFKAKGVWHLLVMSRCKNLLPNNLCGVYETRPTICAEYDPTDCEFTGEVPYDLYFDGHEPFEAWLALRKTKRRADAALRARKAASRRAAKTAPGARKPKLAVKRKKAPIAKPARTRATRRS